ncbi:MAG: hypothetical protein HKN84_00905, partial [Gammaproteobacteria bacterium]|nr:hypothetical protein [Gammaproteobacteria bacterium]
MAARIKIVVLLVVLVASGPLLAQDLPPLEAYGRLPLLDIMELSPDGSRIATRVTQDGEDRVVVLDAATGGVVTSADAAAVNPRRLRFV